VVNQHFAAELEMGKWNPSLDSFVLAWLCHSICDHFSVTAELQNTFVLHTNIEQQGVCRLDDSKNMFINIVCVLIKREIILHVNVLV